MCIMIFVQLCSKIRKIWDTVNFLSAVIRSPRSKHNIFSGKVSPSCGKAFHILPSNTSRLARGGFSSRERFVYIIRSSCRLCSSSRRTVEKYTSVPVRECIRRPGRIDPIIQILTSGSLLFRFRKFIVGEKLRVGNIKYEFKLWQINYARSGPSGVRLVNSDERNTRATFICIKGLWIFNKNSLFFRKNKQQFFGGRVLAYICIILYLLAYANPSVLWPCSLIILYEVICILLLLFGIPSIK